MKKILLSAAAIFAAMSLNAQEVAVFNADNALNLDSENGTALTAGTVIGQTGSIIATIGADDTYEPQSATFTVNGTEITGGLQGATNPKDADGGVPATTLIQPAELFDRAGTELVYGCSLTLQLFHQVEGTVLIRVQDHLIHYKLLFRR